MPDYSNGKIYTIRCLNNPNVYVGSTIQPLAVRMGGHRKDYVKNKVLGRNKEIVSDISEWYIKLYENYPCNKREELARREGEIIREIGTLNKNIAGRTITEYNNDKKEDIIKRQNEYFEDYPEYKIEFERRNKNRNERFENNKLILKQKKEQAFENNNLNGVIYTRDQLEKICFKNNTKKHGSMYKMRLKLSKIENLLIPEELKTL